MLFWILLAAIRLANEIAARGLLDSLPPIW